MPLNPLNKTEQLLRKDIQNLIPSCHSAYRRTMLKTAYQCVETGHKWSSTYSPMEVDRDICKEYAYANFSVARHLIDILRKDS